MCELSEIKLFMCACSQHILTAQRNGNDLILDYFIGYRPEKDDRVEDYFVYIPLSVHDSIAKRMNLLLSSDNEEDINFVINFENEYTKETGTEIKQYALTISKMGNMYFLMLERTDIKTENDEPSFIWEWGAYRTKFEELAILIQEMEDQLAYELYS